MYATAEQVIELGISRATLRQKLTTGEWQSRGRVRRRGGKLECYVLVASLPTDYQVKFLQRQALSDSAASSPTLLEMSDTALHDQERKLRSSLLRIAPEERAAWINEAFRLAKIVERYGAVKPRWRLDPESGKYKFVPEVMELCREAACTCQIILSREPHRADPPSPYTVDDWLRMYREDGLLIFIRSAPTVNHNKPDKRRADISKGAIEWVNDNWRKFKSARHLFKAVERRAKEKGWVIPSCSWFYRNWRNIPAIIQAQHLHGESYYISKYAPYVPRDYSDLQALQVLCGDHSERDVTVLLADGSLRRPWLTLWLDLRTWLIWGWHLDLIPSSSAIALAYADGVQNFGAQPPSRPDDGFHSFVYTDHGRTYKSHHWDGTIIAVHKEAMKIDGGLELLLVQRKVGILEDFSVKHLLARRWNGREKPAERVFKDISDWEENTFADFCGRDAKSRPDLWRNLYARHLRVTKGKRGTSPFVRFELYRDKLAEFITQYNASAHERSTLGGQSVMPIDEYRHLYLTRYEISNETLSLLLMKAEKRVIGKNGVQCFQKHWFYYHESMAGFKGATAEIRFTDGDYSRVWVILPNKQICEASLITPTSIINPDKRTLKAVAEAKAHERELMRGFNLIAQSQLRGETTEDRVVGQLTSEARGMDQVSAYEPGPNQTVVHRLPRIDRKKLLLLASNSDVSAAEVAEVDTDASIFNDAEYDRVSEFYGDD